MKLQYKNYLLFWFGGSLSQLGSSMTSFALILWVYSQSNSALSISLLLFFNYVPFIVASLFAGPFIDRHYKKYMIIITDMIAAIMSISVFVLWHYHTLYVYMIYVINAVIGCMDAFQSPAQSIMMRIMVHKEHISQASGLDSLTNNAITILSPAFATALFAFFGLGGVLLFDICSFLINLCILFCVHIHEPTFILNEKKESLRDSYFTGIKFLHQNQGIFMMIITLCMLNFFSGLSFQNILSPMLLARTHNNAQILSAVNMVMGISGIAGGILVTAYKPKWNCVSVIYAAGCFSFLFGDVCMGVSTNIIGWCLAALFANLPIAFLNASERIVLYDNIPEKILGSVLSIRNALQFSSIPLGLLAGGYLADTVFEPLVKHSDMSIISNLVGHGSGSGMALMFILTGMAGSTLCYFFYRSKPIQSLKEKMKEYE